jgi:hypothetical protein
MRTISIRLPVGKVLLIAWAILCLSFFAAYPGTVSHVQSSYLGDWRLFAEKWGRLDLLRDLANLVLSFIGIIAFSAACTSLGAFAVKISKVDFIARYLTGYDSLAYLATEFLIGHGLFSIIFLTLGGLSQLKPAYGVSLLLLGFLLGIREIKKTTGNAFAETYAEYKKLTGNKWNRTIILLSMTIGFLSLVQSTALISYDSTSIYFSDAKITAMTQQVEFFTDDNFIASAFQSTIQYAVLIQIFGDQSARMFSWMCGVVIIIFSLALGKRIALSEQANLILFTLLLTSTAFLDLMGDGKVDLISSAPAIAAVYWMVMESQNKKTSKPILVLVGFLIGLAIVARPFNFFLLGVFTLLFYVQRIYARGFERSNYKLLVTSMLYLGMGAIGFVIYHLFANWMIHGNPFAFLSSVSKINPSTGPWNYDPRQILAVRLGYPLIATFYNSPQTLGNISPIVMAFLPALLIYPIRKDTQISRQLYVLLAVSIVTLLLWIFLFFTVYEIRYVVFLWVIIFMPVAEIISTAIRNRDRLLQGILKTLIVAQLLFTLFRTVYISIDAYSPVDEQGNPQCFCDEFDRINETAAPGDRVLTLTAFRYYLRSDLFACSTTHDEYKALTNAAKTDSELFWLKVYQQGYKYIVYEREYTTRHLQMGLTPGPQNAPTWLELKSLYGKPGDSFITYRINFKSRPGELQTSCQKDSSNRWITGPAIP